MLAALAEIGASSGLAEAVRAAASPPVVEDDGDVVWPDDVPVDPSPAGQAAARVRFLAAMGGG